TSDLIAKLSGMYLQANKAIIGRNAYAHESGIHQDGVLKNAETYEIITPELVGVSSTRLFMGKHCGKHAFKDKVKEFGVEMTAEEVKRTYKRFKVREDNKREVTDDHMYSRIMETKTAQSAVNKCS